MTGDIKAFIDSVNFQKDRLGSMGQIVLSVKAADIIASGIQAMEQEIARLINDKCILKSTLVTVESDLYQKEDILEAKENELADLREKLDLLAEEPVVKPREWDMKELQDKVIQLNWRVTKLEHGIGGTIEHLTREGA